MTLLHSPPIAHYPVTEMALQGLEPDLFRHVVSFLHLEEIAVLMPTCRMMRQKVTELPAWGHAEAELSRCNCFDHCSDCGVPWRSPGHAIDGCKKSHQHGSDDYAWLEANDPRLDRTYPEKTGFVQFGLLYQFHAMCVENLMGFFDLGGDCNSLENTPNFVGEEHPWVTALNDLFESSPRHFHLLNDIVSMCMACGDLCAVDGGPYWYRQWFQGSYEDPDSGSSFRDAFHDHMEAMYDLATEHEVDFGSDQHIRIRLGTARTTTGKVLRNPKLRSTLGRQRTGRERLGTRLLHKVKPLRMLRDKIEQILGRCREEEEEETSASSQMTDSGEDSGDADEPDADTTY